VIEMKVMSVSYEELCCVGAVATKWNSSGQFIAELFILLSGDFFFFRFWKLTRKLKGTNGVQWKGREHFAVWLSCVMNGMGKKRRIEGGKRR
jgi:hypothetical protein